MKIDPSFKEFATPRQAQYVDAINEHGSIRAAARALGVGRGTITDSIAGLMKKVPSANTDDIVREAAAAGGIENPDVLSHFWKIAKDEDGNGFSLFIKNPAAKTEVKFADLVRQAVAEGSPKRPTYKPPVYRDGTELLVIDLADVHFLKLATRSQTGYVYNRDVARARTIEGTRALLRRAAGMNIGHILFVLGNDILHIDNNRSTTENGTFQDTDGTLYQGFLDAKDALLDAVAECAEVAPVSLLHCMSNHDRTMGWAISQVVAAVATQNPRVSASPYNLSERSRKYFRFERNLLGLTHGDGAKEEALYSLMVSEAREHISGCQNLYWKIHHFHHKIRKTRGELPFLREKDHRGMTLMQSGAPNLQGEHLDIEYVRSPSAPDAWHDLNGHVNRQAVECFIFHAIEGQNTRFTVWF